MELQREVSTSNLLVGWVNRTYLFQPEAEPGQCGGSVKRAETAYSRGTSRDRLEDGVADCQRRRRKAASGSRRVHGGGGNEPRRLTVA